MPALVRFPFCSAALPIGLLTLVMIGPACRSSWASGPKEEIPQLSVLAAFEQNADHADIREQPFLYSQLLHNLTELEGKEIGDGDEDAAAATLGHIDQVAAKLKAAERKDAKRLKNVEVLMEHTTHRLGDMLHLASEQERASMNATLEKLNHVHDDILALVFSR